MHSEQEIDAAIGRISGGRVLDIATGSGGMIIWLTESLGDYDEIVGIDTIDLTSRIPKDEESIFDQPNIHFYQMDAHHLDFPDASFDTVTMSNSLHHMADPQQVLAEVGRVLRPGGHVLISEMYSDNQTEEQMTHIHLHHWWSAVDTSLGISHNETGTRQEMIELIDTIGLREVALYDYADLESDPFDEVMLARMYNHIDRYLERASALPNYPVIEARSEELRQRLAEIGLRWATSLVVIGQK
jgi:SAM-dependent methyltransferase